MHLVSVIKINPEKKTLMSFDRWWIGTIALDLALGLILSPTLCQVLADTTSINLIIYVFAYFVGPHLFDPDVPDEKRTLYGWYYDDGV